MRSIRAGVLALPAVAALLLAILPSACGDEGGPALPERHARRFLPFTPGWIPESRVPKAPQKTPAMVIWEVTETLEEPGPLQEEAAREWVERCHAAARRHGWFDFAKGRADGFALLPSDTKHYRNTDHLVDGRILDPDRPEFLMYYPTPDGGRGLAGFMFITESLEARGPQFAGRRTIWHYHVFNKPYCLVAGIALDFLRPGERCERGEAQQRSPEMIHTWLIDNPGGPFATSMLLPPEVVAAGLTKRQRERGY